MPSFIELLEEAITEQSWEKAGTAFEMFAGRPPSPASSAKPKKKAKTKKSAEQTTVQKPRLPFGCDAPLVSFDDPKLFKEVIKADKKFAKTHANQVQPRDPYMKPVEVKCDGCGNGFEVPVAQANLKIGKEKVRQLCNNCQTGRGKR